jgi:non-ribosomal peptide synthetase component F
MLAVYFALLFRYTQQADLAVSSMFANRSRPEVMHTVGFFSNMVVLRLRSRARPTLNELIRETSTMVIGALGHQLLPFQMLPSNLIDSQSVRADAVVFQMFSGPMNVTKRENLIIEPIIDIPTGIGNRWEFELSVMPTERNFSTLLYYTDGLYDDSWANKFIENYINLASIASDNPDVPLVSLEI